MKDLVYGQKDTYKSFLDKDTLKFFTDKTNRSDGQTQFLFNLVNCDIEKLKELETKIKNCFISYCPDSDKEVKQILEMTNTTNYFSF